MRRFLLNLSAIIILAILPFVLLIRGAVFFHETYKLQPWGAILGGIILCTFLLFTYITVVRWYFSYQSADWKKLRRLYLYTVLLVVTYCLPSLFFLSDANAKYPEIKQEFRALHPILRLSISTLVFLDRDVLITDADRVPEDYKKMGLRTKKQSLHYKQSNGYVHAVDIRTKGQTKLRNLLVTGYFKLMGFNTLRHGGTADHLHISLKSHDRPHGI